MLPIRGRKECRRKGECWQEKIPILAKGASHKTDNPQKYDLALTPKAMVVTTLALSAFYLHSSYIANADKELLLCR